MYCSRFTWDRAFSSSRGQGRSRSLQDTAFFSICSFWAHDILLASIAVALRQLAHKVQAWRVDKGVKGHDRRRRNDGDRSPPVTMLDDVAWAGIDSTGSFIGLSSRQMLRQARQSSELDVGIRYKYGGGGDPLSFHSTPSTHRPVLTTLTTAYFLLVSPP